MHSLRISGAALAAALATTGVAASGAQARTENVVPTIRHESRTLKAAVASENLKNVKIKTRAEARRAVPKFRTLANTLDRVATVVSRSSTSSTAQRRGKDDWVMGTRGVARGYRQFDVALNDLARGHRATAKREALRAEGTMLRSAKTLIRADRLLKLNSR
jgi:ABC-type proline/glycine betaine transport system substrate-binding protein